jgi:hypothetical protein
MQFLNEHLIVFDGESETVKRFKLTFADALNSSYEPQNESIANSPALISSFLDARYKDLDCISSNIRVLTFETIKLKMQEIVVEEPECEEVEPKRAHIENSRALEFESVFGSQKNRKLKKVPTVEEEFELFQKKHLIDITEDLLIWRKENKQYFPRLKIFRYSNTSVTAE